MRDKAFAAAFALAIMLAPTQALAQGGKTRVSEDRGQQGIASKVYELKNVAAADIAPFIDSALRASSPAASARAVSADGKERLLLTMPASMAPFADEMVARLDRKSETKDKSGSSIEGTGAAQGVYRPKHISAKSAAAMLSMLAEDSGGRVFHDSSANIVYWKGPPSMNDAVAKLMSQADLPAAQMRVRLKAYQIGESELASLKAGLPPKADLAEALAEKSKERVAASAEAVVSGSARASSFALGAAADGIAVSLKDATVWRSSDGRPSSVFADIEISLGGRKVQTSASLFKGAEKALAAFALKRAEGGGAALFASGPLTEIAELKRESSEQLEFIIITGSALEAGPDAPSSMTGTQKALIEELDEMRKTE